MKNVVIGAVVAAIIVFVYQAMSWMILPVHENTLKYSSQQDAIIEAIAQNLTEDGVYAIPNVPPGTSQEEQQKFSEGMMGKPSAIITYKKAFTMNMGTQMSVGFFLNLVAAFIIAYFLWLSSAKLPTFGSKLMVALGFAVFTVFQSTLMMANWWLTPWHYISGEIIDQIVGWLLGGIWLSWWFGRKQTT